MTDIPDSTSFIQIEETSAYAPVSQNTLFKVGGAINFLLDHYPVEPGTIHMFAGPEIAVPPGYLVCDGRTFSRTTYANLFAAIGTYWGIGDGLTTGSTPDMRGIFPRMVDLTSVGPGGQDPNAATRAPLGTGGPQDPGSFQGDALNSHQHQLPISGGSTAGAGIVTDGGPFSYATAVTAAAVINVSGGVTSSESRPKNMYVLMIIKW